MWCLGWNGGPIGIAELMGASFVQMEPGERHSLVRINTIHGLCALWLFSTLLRANSADKGLNLPSLTQLVFDPISVRKPRYIRREQLPDKNRDPPAFSTVEAHISNV